MFTYRICVYRHSQELFYIRRCRERCLAVKNVQVIAIVVLHADHF